MFAAWVASGLDEDRLAGKVGRLLGQMTGPGSTRGRRGAGEKKNKGGVRGVFESHDRDAAGVVSRHDMKVGVSPDIRYETRTVDSVCVSSCAHGVRNTRIGGGVFEAKVSKQPMVESDGTCLTAFSDHGHEHGKDNDNHDDHVSDKDRRTRTTAFQALKHPT